MIYTDFQNKERARQLQLLEKGFFEGAEGGGYAVIFDEETNKKKTVYSRHILKPEYSIINLYPLVREEALWYFERYDIVWWRLHTDRYFPSGHLLSSQIHCLNHLFALRQDPNAVLAMIKPLGEAAGIHFDKVLPSFIDTKEHAPHKSYISFEFVCNNISLLNERQETRGANCTSVDALIYARAGNEKWLVPIEWKYTEAYDHDPKKVHSFDRYKDKITPASRLTEWGDLFRTDPFYELGRQTLLMEAIITGNTVVAEDTLHADNFLHLIVIPAANMEMNDDAKKFKDSVKDEYRKYVRIITPENLLNPVETQYGEKYGDLIAYLKKRY